MNKTIIAMGLMFAASQAVALDVNDLYFGAGTGSADYDCAAPGCGSERELHVFAGLPLVDLGPAKLSGEAGFYDVGGNIDTSGATVAAVASLPVTDDFSVHGRLGADTNSDMDLLFFGVGAAFKINANFGGRVDYTMGETDIGGTDVDTLSLSVIYRL